MSVACTVGAVDTALEPQSLKDSWRISLSTDEPSGWFPSGLVVFYMPRKDTPFKVGDKVQVPVKFSNKKVGNTKIIGFARDANERLDLP